jgi:hypothetical protein
MGLPFLGTLGFTESVLPNLPGCRFCDVTEAGDARFIVALRRSQTLEGCLQENVAKQ